MKTFLLRRPLILSLIVTFSVLSAQAAPRSKAQMKTIALERLRSTGKMAAPGMHSDVVELKACASLSLFGYEDGAYVVVSNDDRFPAVLGVSDTPYSHGANANFEFWLRSMSVALAYMAENNLPARITTPDPNIYPTSVAPLMTSKWDQLNPYNRMLPPGIYTGCVATAMAQVLNYHKMPEHGYGTRTIQAKGTPVTANFEEDYYDWDNMLDVYRGVQYNDAEADAVALLMRDCGVAANMSYGTAVDGGSGAYSTDAASGLRTYFGLEDAKCVERSKYIEPDWMDLVYNELSNNGPVYYGGTDMSQFAGHAFVLHGYNEEGMVYVNWGWSGDDDGYYDISLLNPPGNRFSSDQDMIIGIAGSGITDLVGDTVELAQAGELAQCLHAEENVIGWLKVKGNINGTDLKTIRRMAGCDEQLKRTKGRLRSIDLTEARLVSGGDAYVEAENQVLKSRDDALGEKAFYGCRTLNTILLPSSITRIGQAAFAGCSSLDSILIPENEAQDFLIRNHTLFLKSDTLSIYQVLPVFRGKYEIEKGVTQIGDYAFAGCSRISGVVVPSTVARIGSHAFAGCTGLTTLRLMLVNVPETGANAVDGVYTSSCKLYVPAGSKDRYKQHAQWGLFASGAGHDNIVEFGSAITARNAGRYYGEENPLLGYKISGDIPNGEPELVCEATEESPAGQYPIRVLRGTITDEIVELYDGVLFVWQVPLKVSTGDYTRMEGEENPDFELTYDGFVRGEDLSVITRLPVATCEARPDSPAGVYPITISGGEAQNYSFKYTAGTLTVEPNPDGIREVGDAANHHYDVYTTDGRKIKTGVTSLQQLPKGIYVVDGKKRVVK